MTLPPLPVAAPATAPVTEPLLANSATKLPDDAAGRIVVCGSHGGVYAGWLLAKAGVAAGVLHDAGVGRDNAGIGSLARFADLALATVAHTSAAIGDAAAMLRTGVVSHCNDAASALGVAPGMACDAAVRVWLEARAPAASSAPLSVAPLAEARHVSVHDGIRHVCVDSASLVRSVEDDDAIIACGSHGGVVVGQAHLAIRASARLAIYNDAGGGAGTGRLPLLDERGIAAATVAAMSARIGDGRSTLHDGVLSAVNETAHCRGLRVGMTARAAARMMSAMQQDRNRQGMTSTP